MKVFQIKDDVFKTKPLFVIGCSFQKLERYLKRFNVKPGEYVDQAGQMFTFGKSPWRVVWVEKLPTTIPTLGILLHEIYHLVTRICQDKGIRIQAHIDTDSGDETAAYLYEFFCREAIRRSGITLRTR